MPQGNAQALPSGIWTTPPTQSTLPKLLGGSALRLSTLFFFVYCLGKWRELQFKVTYTGYVGKSLSLGNLSALTHEPFTTEQIDQLKAEQAARKAQHS